MENLTSTSALPVRRWNLGFIIQRWRHVFWILPLVGLMAGAAFHFVVYRNMAAVSAILQIRPSAGGPGSVSPLSVPAAMAAIKSDAVLGAASDKADLPTRWNTTRENSIRGLAALVKLTPIPGTSLIEVKVRTAKTADSLKICEAVIEAAAEQLREEAKREHSADISRAAEEVEIQSAAVERIRQELTGLIRSEGPQGASSGDYAAKKAEFEDTQNKLGELKVAQISREMQYKVAEDPLIVHEAPRMPVGSGWGPARFRALFLVIAVGTVCGILLSVIIAYILEAFFLRKSPPHAG